MTDSGPLGVFLSYRREDSSGHAGRLADALAQRFGAQSVFLDVESIEPGADFVEALASALEQCSVVLAVVGINWLTAEQHGRRRLEDPDDFVRLEIEGALDKGVRVVPVLVNGAVMPSANDLPPELAAFARCHAFELRDQGWNDSSRVLLDLVARWIKRDPAASTLTLPRDNLPVLPDRLIGRKEEIAEVGEHLTRDRLVTLTGTGGSGKTRLAIAVGASVSPRFLDGVWLVPLAAATTNDQLLELVAQALDVTERGDESLLETVLARASSRQLLLLLDNCEQLIESVAAFVDELLARCPLVRVLATSRELLGIRGEHVFPVHSLSVGDPTNPGAAVTLFVERATALATEFRAEKEDLALVAEVCRRLDGLPLAIELAAARLRSFSLRALADRLDDRFHLLTGGSRTASPRHRTLEAVIAWSYDLLDDSEQAMLRRVAILAESFTLDSAESVVAWGDVEAEEVLDITGRLIDKSLVSTSPGGSDYRYHLSESVRQYGRERLSAAGEQDASLQHLFNWARAWCDRLEMDRATPGQDVSAEGVADERENLRAVYEQVRSGPDLELALRLLAFAPIMLPRERRSAIEALLLEAVEIPAAPRGHALISLAEASFAIGLAQEGIGAAQRAAQCFESIDDLRQAALAHHYEVVNAWGFLPDATTRLLVTNQLTRLQHVDEPWLLGLALWIASQLEPDLEYANTQAAEAEALFRDAGSPFGLAHSLEGRALISMHQTDYQAAADYLAEALELLADSEQLECIAHVLDAVALLLARREHAADAACLLGVSDELRRRAGTTPRLWELRSLEEVEQLLDGPEFEAARRDGRGLALKPALDYVTHLLESTRHDT